MKETESAGTTPEEAIDLPPGTCTTAIDIFESETPLMLFKACAAIFTVHHTYSKTLL